MKGATVCVFPREVPPECDVPLTTTDLLEGWVSAPRVEVLTIRHTLTVNKDCHVIPLDLLDNLNNTKINPSKSNGKIITGTKYVCIHVEELISSFLTSMYTRDPSSVLVTGFTLSGVTLG